MAKELFDGIYSSHKVVFIERIEKNLQFYLREKIKKIKKSGQEIIVDIEKDDLDSTISELKNNPEFGVEILGSINYILSGRQSYLLLSMSSISNNFSMVLKVKIESGPENMDNLKKEFHGILEIIGEHYPIAGFFKEERSFRQYFNDVIIKGQVPDGLDCFDSYIVSGYGEIEKIFIDGRISAIPAEDIFCNIEFERLLTIVSRLDFSAGIFPEIGLCLALEEILQLKVSKRAQLIRMLVCELFRITNHLYFISKIAKIAGSEFSFNRALIERDRAMRLTELITGARIHPNFSRIGGVRQNINEEKILNIKKNMKILLHKVDNLETIFLDNTLITAKLKNSGIIRKETALKFGLSGPNLRSCGVRYDLRKNRNLLLYKDISFLVPFGKFGDCLERLQIRFNEIYQSIKIIQQITDSLPDETIRKLDSIENFEIDRTEAVSSIECPHGVYKLFIEIENNKILNLVPVAPSLNNLFCAREILAGNNIEDFNLILASLDISSGEMLQGHYL